MHPISPVRATLAGLSASLVGIGLARFAYSPLIPALVEQGWFDAGDTAYLGAANLVGYLVGAVVGRRAGAVARPAIAIRGFMLAAALAFVACAHPVSFPWFFAWRLLSGVAGGALMVLAAPTVLAHVPPERRGLAGGVIFTGVGIGIAASGLVVPPLLALGLKETWYGLGLLSLGLTALAWTSWPGDAPPAPPVVEGAEPVRAPGAFRALLVVYGLNAVGLVPHTVLLVDYVARGLGQGLAAGARDWVVFGIGAMAGPVLAGAMADRIGFRAALRVALALQAVCVGLLALTPAPAAILLSSLVVGAFVPGIVPLVLGRVQELVPPDPASRRTAWSLATMAFALGQAGAAYGFSALFAAGGGYPLLFTLGAGALAAALVVDGVVGARRGGRGLTG